MFVIQVERAKRVPPFAAFHLLEHLPYIQDPHYSEDPHIRLPSNTNYNMPRILGGIGQRVTLLHRPTDGVPFRLWAAECTTAVDTGALEWMTSGKATLWLDCRSGAGRPDGRSGPANVAEHTTMTCTLPGNIKRCAQRCNELLHVNEFGALKYPRLVEKTFRDLFEQLFCGKYQVVVITCAQAANRTAFIAVCTLMMCYGMYSGNDADLLYQSLRRLRAIFDISSPPPDRPHQMTGLDFIRGYGDLLRQCAEQGAWKCGIPLPSKRPNFDKGFFYLPYREWQKAAWRAIEQDKLLAAPVAADGLEAAPASSGSAGKFSATSAGAASAGAASAGEAKAAQTETAEEDPSAEEEDKPEQADDEHGAGTDARAESALRTGGAGDRRRSATRARIAEWNAESETRMFEPSGSESKGETEGEEESARSRSKALAWLDPEPRGGSGCPGAAPVAQNLPFTVEVLNGIVGEAGTFIQGLGGLVNQFYQKHHGGGSRADLSDLKSQVVELAGDGKKRFRDGTGDADVLPAEKRTMGTEGGGGGAGGSSRGAESSSVAAPGAAPVAPGAAPTLLKASAKCGPAVREHTQEGERAEWERTLLCSTLQ